MSVFLKQHISCQSSQKLTFREIILTVVFTGRFSLERINMIFYKRNSFCDCVLGHTVVESRAQNNWSRQRIVIRTQLRSLILLLLTLTDDYRIVLVIYHTSIITLMVIENRVVRSFALSRYNHRAVIITLKASSFQNGSQVFWCFGVGNWSILLFFRKIINVIILKQLVARGD